jgi:hypothetical protein
VSREEHEIESTHIDTFKGLQVGQLARNALEGIVVNLHASQSQTTRLWHKKHTDKMRNDRKWPTSRGKRTRRFRAS